MASRQQSTGGGSLLEQLSAVETASHEPLDERKRREALAVAKRIVSTLEKPEEVVMRYANEVSPVGFFFHPPTVLIYLPKILI